MLEKSLHTGNIAAAFGVLATTADLTVAGGLGTAIGAALSVTSMMGGKPGLSGNARLIAKDLKAKIERTHLSEDQQVWLGQMVMQFAPTESDFTAANMNGAALAERLIDLIKAAANDTELKSDGAISAFRSVMPDVYQSAIDRAIATNETQSAMLKELLDRSNTSGAANKLRDEGITGKAIIRLAQRIAADTGDVGQAWLELQNAMDIAVRVQAEGRVKSNHGDFVDTVLERVAELARDGDYTAASAEIDDALGQAEAQMSRLLDSGVEVALLERDTTKAASLLVRKADLEAGGTTKFEALRALLNSYYVIGRDKGSNLDSALAVDLASLILTRASDANQRGKAGNDKGNALLALGKREAGTERLDQAVVAYTEALKEFTRDRVPMDWALTQMNLGAALSTLGEREAGTERLDQAVAAYTEALKERTRDRVPMQWAITKHCWAAVEIAYFDKTQDQARLDVAYAHAQAAKEVFVEARADHYIGSVGKNLTAIKQRRRNAGG